MAIPKYDELMKPFLQTLADGEVHKLKDINMKLADAPIVEGAIAAAVTAVCGSKLDEVVTAAEQTRTVKKINN